MEARRGDLLDGAGGGEDGGGHSDGAERVVGYGKGWYGDRQQRRSL